MAAETGAAEGVWGEHTATFSVSALSFLFFT